MQQLCYSKKESLHQKGDAWIKFDNTYCIAFNLNGNQEKLEHISFLLFFLGIQYSYFISYFNAMPVFCPFSYLSNILYLFSLYFSMTLSLKKKRLKNR